MPNKSGLIADIADLRYDK